jgi:hypothetical protein
MLMVYLRRTKGHPINRPPRILHVEKLWHTEGSVEGITKTPFLPVFVEAKKVLTLLTAVVKLYLFLSYKYLLD